MGPIFVIINNTVYNKDLLMRITYNSKFGKSGVYFTDGSTLEVAGDLVKAIKDRTNVTMDFDMLLQNM